MAQNLLSRIFGAGSVYETLNDRDDESQYSLHAQPSHYDMTFKPFRSRGHLGDDDAHSAVPESLLYEGAQPNMANLPPRPDEEEHPSEDAEDLQRKALRTSAFVSSHDRARWKWANVDNLDNFLHDVYAYYLGNGIYSILLSRLLNLLTMAFVTGFSTYLGGCIDYSRLRQASKLSDIQIESCVARMSGTSITLLWLLTLFWFIKLFQYISDIRMLWDMHNFYRHLLEVSEADMQTIGWQEITTRLMGLRDDNPVTANAGRTAVRVTKQRMDAHDIANRIMRKENYLVALFNKDVLDFSLPLLPGRQVFTRAMEWNLGLCVLQYVFDEHGQVRPAFLNDTHRRSLAEGLRRRFLFAGIMNAVLAPFIIVYLLLVYFFRYFNEYHKNPAAIGSRTYTPYALWKFREFNELTHIFQKRVNLSHACADRYVSQFPNDKTVQIARFISFVAGSFAAVLALASVIDPELFLGFEVTHDRTVLFYLGLFGTLVALSRSLVPGETIVFEPEEAIRDVIEYTHYCPEAWRNNLHSHDVKREFAELYDYKLSIFIQEIVSVLVVPLVLWFSLPRCSERIVDFIRDFTVHVDGIGHVCSFAVFDFVRHGNVRFGAPKVSLDAQKHLPPQGEVRQNQRGRQEQQSSLNVSNDGKMEKSFLNFKASNPSWQPDPAGSAFLASLQNREHRSTGRTRLSDSYAPATLRGGGGVGVRSTRGVARIREESPHRSPLSPPQVATLLGESFLDPTKLISSPVQATERPTGAGVLNMVHRFYQEAGNKPPV